MKGDEKAVSLFLLGRTFAFFSLEYRIQEYCLACGVEIPKALAYGAVTGLVYFLSSFIIAKTFRALQAFMLDPMPSFGLYYFLPLSLQSFLHS